MIDVFVKKELGDLKIDIKFQIGHPMIYAVFGRSGAGKTTLANMLSGLVKPDSGHISFDKITFFDSDSSIDMPPERRGIGYVFQEHRLFPHLSVRKNLTFGQFPGKRKNHADFSKIVDLFAIGHLLDRYPETLSGGESQRVALGRAIFACTSFLIMDEPLSSLDNELKNSLIDYIALIPGNFSVPMIYITHSKYEVSRLAEKVMLIDGGKVAACGGPDIIENNTDL